MTKISTMLAPVAIVVILVTALQAADAPPDLPAGLKKFRTPSDNPYTAAKVDLGRQLFFDARLSSDNTISCASCHNPEKGWSNGERFATGVDGQVGGRSAPSIVNAAYHGLQFWDGRAKGLEGQALGPIQNPIEMNLTLDELIERLESIEGYNQQFQSVFGAPPTPEAVAKAIAAFERTVLSGDAPYDHYEAGDEDALSPAAKRGYEVFFHSAHCSACHSGPNFSDGGFHNIGVGIDQDEPDVGREQISGLSGDRAAFKTPSLRDIARTAPYMHDGSLATLRDVVDYYVKGGNPNPQLDEEIYPLELTEQQRADLVTFLEEGLSSRNYPVVKPPKLPE